MQQSLSQKPLKKKNGKKVTHSPWVFEYKRQKNINTHIPVLKNRLFGLKVTVQWWCLLCKMCAWCSSCLYFLCLCTHALTVCLSTWRHACSLTRVHIQCCVPHMFTCTSLLLFPPLWVLQYFRIVRTREDVGEVEGEGCAEIQAGFVEVPQILHF